MSIGKLDKAAFVFGLHNKGYCLSKGKFKALEPGIEPGKNERSSAFGLLDRLVEAHRRTAEAFLEGKMPAWVYFLEQAL